ncbi:MAG: cytochrome b [Betaproteobacteria bacterium]|jgi:cytochrome b561|nr:MAG: cytochrome b [Betaproteobacteria bacterium]
MPQSRFPARYSAVAMALHWAIAALIVVDFAFALSFSQFNPGDALYLPSAYRLHMSTGLSVLALSALRVLWRLMHRYPALPADIHLATRLVASLSHVLLYAFMLVAPLTGWFVLSVRRKPTSMFGLFTWPDLSWLAGMPHDQRVIYHDALLPLHTWISYAGIALVGLHVCAALYHHFYWRDDILRRMLPRMPARRAVPVRATDPG